MKSLVLIILPLILFHLSSCSDSSDSTPQNIDTPEFLPRRLSFETSIIGSWEIRSSEGGLLPGKTYQQGNGKCLRFTDSFYETYDDGVLKEQIPYRLERSKSMNSDSPMHKLILEGREGLEYRVAARGSKLTLEAGTSIAADGVILIYEYYPCNTGGTEDSGN